MAQKKITSTIARILAEKVKSQLTDAAIQVTKECKKEIENSKEYKAIDKTRYEIHTLYQKIDDLKKNN